MAKGGQAVFAEDSDHESVNTNTTEEDYDPDKEYDVECVLAEQAGDEGTMYYLIKWEGYPLYDCTWEKKANITHDIVLRHWQADKRLIQEGKKQAFDVSTFERAFEEHHEELERKRKLRKAKKRARGIVVSEDDEYESESSYDLPTTETPKRSRAKAASPIKRKGVAQPVVKRRNTQSKTTDVEDDAGHDSGPNSLFDEDGGAPIIPPASPEPEKATTAPTAAVGRYTLSKPGATSSTIHQPPPKDGPVATKSPPLGQRKASDSGNTTNQTGARKSSAAVGTGKPASKANVFANWTANKKRKGRPRVSGETPKGSTDPKFRNLSIQNRYQKYSKNELPPDPNMLVMVDPKTGRRQPPAASAQTPATVAAATTSVTAAAGPKPLQAPARTGPEDIHSAYGRRTPPRARQRTPSPPSPQRQPSTKVQQPITDNDPLDPGFYTYNDGNGAKIAPKIRMTCKYWKDGHCQYAKDTCRYYHEDIASGAWPPKKQVTCHYWSKGRCNKSEQDCEFCHYWTNEVASSKRSKITCYYWATNGYCSKRDEDCDFAHQWTGEVANGPGTFQNSRKASLPFTTGANGTELGQVRIASSVAQFTPLSPVEQSPARVPSPPPPPPPPPAPQHPEVEMAPSLISSEPATDPRLKGRAPPQVNTIIQVSGDPHNSAVTGTTKPTPIHTTTDVEMKDLIDSPQGSPEQDLEMAKQGIPNLDSAKLLSATGSGRDVVENVYIHMPSRPAELKWLEHYFNGLNRKVYTSNAMGAWSFFSKTESSKNCLLIVHPDEHFAGSLPGLSNLLSRYGPSFRVFSIGVQYAQCMREKRPPAYESQRLFPHAVFTYITDDVFVYYPEQATQIIEEFNKDTETKPAGAQMSKIGARPGIKDWLLKLTMKKMEEHAGHEAALPYLQAYDALCKLCPLSDEDGSYLPEEHVPLESSYLWSPSADSMPSFKSRWENGDEEGATDYMANNFAGEACWKAWRYRKFYFVYQRPDVETMEMNSQGAQEVRADADPKGWMKKYSHILVMTPDQMLKNSQKKKEKEKSG